MDKLSIEERIKAEVYNFSGLVGVYANDFRGNVIEINSQEKFESASCIKVFVLPSCTGESTIRRFLQMRC